MSMSYKEDLERCIAYLCKEKESLEKDELWDESSSELYEELEEYCRAISGALEVIEYYEGRDAILKVQHGSEFIEKLDLDWYKSKTAALAERMGIGFEKGEESDDK